MSQPAGAASLYGCLAAEGTDAVGALLKRCVYVRLREAASEAEVAAAFGRLYSCTWLELSFLIGPRGTRAVAERALRRALTRTALLWGVDVHDDGLSFERLQISAEASEGGPALQEALADLYFSCMEIMCSLIGVDLVQSILNRIESLSARREK